MGHQITLTLSNRVYEALRYQAQAQKKSVKQVAEETLRAATLLEKSLRLPLEAALRALVQHYAEALEAVVLAAPYQWFNFYDYWPSDGDEGGVSGGHS